MLWYAAVASSSWDLLQRSLHGANWRHLLMVCTLTCHLHVVHGKRYIETMLHGQMVHGQMLHGNDAAWPNATWK